MRRGLCGAFVLLGIALDAAYAQAPLPSPATSPTTTGMPAQFAPPPLPPLAHEQSSPQWPVDDYFALALKQTGLKPGAAATVLQLRLTAGEQPPHITLPVQTQAFGFSPAFRALVGAELDRQLEAAGLDATRQTDISGATGPFVRRFDDPVIGTFAAEHPKQKLIELYLGHDGVSQMFVTLLVRDGQRRSTAHRSIPLPADAASALTPMAAVLNSLIKEAGLLVAGPAPARSKEAATSCHASTFSLAPPARRAAAAARACHAYVLGSLLPAYDAPETLGSPSDMQSPARLAWLAQAHVLASTEGLTRETASAIRASTLSDLGLATQALEIPGKPAADPVVRQIEQLKNIYFRTAQAPVRSGQAARLQDLQRLTQTLPAFARAVFHANLDATEAFSLIDLCAIERQLPQTMPRPACLKDGEAAAPQRPAWPAETLLYQEWRLASYYKELHFASRVQASRSRADAAIAQWPADVAAHPYLQRMRHVATSSNSAPTPNFNELVAAARNTARTVTQNTVDLQRADRWLSGRSLNGHSWTTMNVMNDAQVRELSNHELRLLSVLRFDRFALDRYHAPRKAGDPAFFLAPTMWLHAMSGGMPGLARAAQGAGDQASGTARPATPPVAIPLSPAKQRPFPPSNLPSQEPSDAQLQAAIEKTPTYLDARARLAVNRLQDGGSLADALKLIDAQPLDHRSDRRIGQSHAWANTADYFYFAGELPPARRYYEKAASFGTGSASEFVAATRLKLLDGRLQEAVHRSAQHAERYDSDQARGEQMSLMMLLGQRDKAWQLFMARAASIKELPLWVGAFVGHRLEKAGLDQVDAWLVAQQLDKNQIDRKDAGNIYLHLHAVLDRFPEESDIQRLKKPRGGKAYVTPIWSVSAKLLRSALMESDYSTVYREATTALTGVNDPSFSFMQPIYTWIAWHATEGKDPYLDDVRGVTTRSTFDRLLSKSMLLALEGNAAESMRYFTAARYQLVNVESDRLVPASYSLAFAGWLMHRKTGQQTYRQETLRFVRTQQKTYPYFGWTYALEALLETQVQPKNSAACKAQFLDASSYFLSQAKVKGLDEKACLAAMASLR